MLIEIIGKKSRTLKSINHGGQTYIEAPTKGEYKIRLRNTSASRRLAIVSVDGVNVLDGKDAGFDGRGYVLRPWETIDIPGWMRPDNKVAKFEFMEQGGSYAAQTGRGVSNVGVIGVAVYDEKVKKVCTPVYQPVQFVPVQPVYHSPFWYATNTQNYGCDSLRMKSDSTIPRSANSVDTNPEEHARGMKTMDGWSECMEQKTSGELFNKIGERHEPVASAACASTMSFMEQDRERAIQDPTKSAQASTFMVQDIGTGYGHEASFYVDTTTFDRATVKPALVVSVRYATRERLMSWGVPVDAPPMPMAPNPFPSSMPSVPAPSGWRG